MLSHGSVTPQILVLNFQNYPQPLTGFFLYCTHHFIIRLRQVDVKCVVIMVFVWYQALVTESFTLCILILVNAFPVKDKLLILSSYRIIIYLCDRSSSYLKIMELNKYPLQVSVFHSKISWSLSEIKLEADLSTY